MNYPFYGDIEKSGPQFSVPSSSSSAIDKQISDSNKDMEGHIEGMLDRDQRTAKIRLTNHEHCAKNCAPNGATASTYGQICDKFSQYENSLKSTTNCHHRHHKHTKHFWISVQKFQQVLIVGVYLTLVTTIPSTLTAPTARMDHKDPLPRWYNPCGSNYKNSGVPFDNNHDADQKYMFNNLLIAVKKAISELNSSKDYVANETFNNSFKSASAMVLAGNVEDNNNFSWIPKLSKRYGQEGHDYLNHLTIENATLESYKYLQTIAAIFELFQSEFGQLDHEQLRNTFERLENNLMSVLCEMQETMSKEQQSEITNVSRDVIPEDWRNMSLSKARPRILAVIGLTLHGMEYVEKWASHFNEASNGQ